MAEPTDYVFAPPPRPSLMVEGTKARFPLRRIFCVGRNYAAHAREMGNDPDREPPFFFTKPADAALDAGLDARLTLPYPPLTQDLHHEVELVVAIGQGGSDIQAADALSHVFGYAVGVDLTRRDLQAAAKKASRPWDWSKAFDRSAPIGPILPLDLPLDKGEGQAFSPQHGAITLSVNGEERQRGDLADQIWPVADVIAAVSTAMRLEAGDLIMTGTPAGVGPLNPGDTLRARIAGLPQAGFALSAR